MPTVLMTGGHAGLGLEGARTLAGRFGCNLILAGRNPERVEAAAQQLRMETGVKIEVLQMDLKLDRLSTGRSGAVQGDAAGWNFTGWRARKHCVQCRGSVSRSGFV